MNLIYPDENLKSMFAFMILIALFFPLVSIRCKLYIINKRQNLFTVHCTCISNIQLSITPTVHHHYYLMLFRISFCVKWRLGGGGGGTLLFFMFCLQEEILFLSIQGINNNDDRNWSNLHYVRKKKRPWPSIVSSRDSGFRIAPSQNWERIVHFGRGLRRWWQSCFYYSNM